MRVRFSREGHDHIGADRGVGHAIADAVDYAAVTLHGVAPGHRLEDIVVAALEGDVEVLADLGQVGAGVDQPFREVAGVAGGEADPLNPLHVMDELEEIGEGVLPAPFRGDSGQVTAVGINVLPQQGDLLEALGGQALHLQLDRLGQA